MREPLARSAAILATAWLCACAPAEAPVAVVIIAPAAPAPPPGPEDAEATQQRHRAEAERSDALRGVGVRIVHTARRKRDAETAAERLRRMGARVLLYETSDTGNAEHLGRLYLKPGHEAQARVIIKAVADLEAVREGPGDGFEEDEPFSLWIAR